MATENVQFDMWCKSSIVKNRVLRFKWDIEDYKTVKANYPQGRYLVSSKFSLNVNGSNVDFWLKLYPNGEEGDDEDEANNIAIFLKSDDAPENSENVKVLAVFSIIDSTGNRCDSVKLGENDEDTLPYESGFLDFIKDDELFAPENKILKDGTLTFVCEITVKFGDVVSKKIKDTKLVEEDTSHSEDMMNMLINAEEHHADIQILCEDGIIPVHSSVLSARSEYFKAMLSNDMEEKKSGKIAKEHLNKSLVFTILEFIYTGKVDPNNISLQLLEESNEMRLIELKKICSKQLSQEVNLANCVIFLITADLLNADDLRESAREFIIENYTDIPTKSRKDLESHPALLSEICSELYDRGAPTAKRQRIE